ncbi:hypothetical protein D3C72_1548880 [compost metagenome]
MIWRCFGDGRKRPPNCGWGQFDLMLIWLFFATGTKCWRSMPSSPRSKLNFTCCACASGMAPRGACRPLRKANRSVPCSNSIWRPPQSIFGMLRMPRTSSMDKATNGSPRVTRASGVLRGNCSRLGTVKSPLNACWPLYTSTWWMPR